MCTNRFSERSVTKRFVIGPAVTTTRQTCQSVKFCHLVCYFGCGEAKVAHAKAKWKDLSRSSRLKSPNWRRSSNPVKLVCVMMHQFRRIRSRSRTDYHGLRVVGFTCCDNFVLIAFRRAARKAQACARSLSWSS